jgi:hypothetical protein
MKNRFLIVALIAVLGACSGGKTEDTTGNIMEMEANQAELDALALQEQPVIVRDFFAVDSATLGDSYCYEYSGISQLILYGNDASETWSKFEISENYLTAFHEECDVLLEFMTFEMKGDKMAYLSQMNKGKQQFNCLKWKKDHWVEVTDYPRPKMKDYFADLKGDEKDLVKEYGADFMYINPSEESVKFVFSEWCMNMNMGEKEMQEFTKEVDFEFELKAADRKFFLEANPLRIEEVEEINL